MQNALSLIAVVISLGSLGVSYQALRSSRPRIRAISTVMADTHITVTNFGGSDTSVTALMTTLRVPAGQASPSRYVLELVSAEWIGPTFPSRLISGTEAHWSTNTQAIEALLGHAITWRDQVSVAVHTGHGIVESPVLLPLVHELPLSRAIAFICRQTNLGGRLMDRYAESRERRLATTAHDQ